MREDPDVRTPWLFWPHTDLRRVTPGKAASLSYQLERMTSDPIRPASGQMFELLSLSGSGILVESGLTSPLNFPVGPASGICAGWSE